MAKGLTLHHVSLYVRDQNDSAVFYRDALGLTEIPNRVDKAHIRWFDLDGVRTIHLIGGDAEVGRPRPLSTHLALATDDLDGLMERLRRAAVVYMDASRKPGAIQVRGDGIRQIYFQDPDGHWIEVNDAADAP